MTIEADPSMHNSRRVTRTGRGTSAEWDRDGQARGSRGISL